jgi:hypothetical protein
MIWTIEAAIDEEGNVKLFEPLKPASTRRALPIRRDAMLPFPCFRTDAKFNHEMSGGPVFDQYGTSAE